MITEKPNDQIAQIEHQIADTVQHIENDQSGVEQIRQGCNARLDVLQPARANILRLQDALERAITYSESSIDTPNSAIANKNVSSLKKELHAAQKYLAKLEAEHAEAWAVEQIAEHELLDHLRLAREKLARLHDELRDAKSATAQASRQQAEQNLASILQGYAEHEQRENASRRQLVEAQVALHDYHQDALEQLEGYPDLQRAIEERQPLDNSTTRLFEATIWYIEAFMTNARDIERVHQIPSLKNTGNGSYQDLLAYLIVQPGDLYDFLRRPIDASPPPMLPIMRDRMQGLLEEYRAWKREQG